MNNPITFPGLGLTLDPPRYFLFPGTEFKIYFYGVIIALGLILAVIYGLRRSRKFGLTQDDILDGVLWIVPFAVICARAFYCIFEWKNLYADNPISVLYIRDGGLAILGGVIGAAIGILIYAKIKKLSAGAIYDIVALGFLIGQAIGRWGNFMNREAFGEQTEVFWRMGLVINGELGYYHPTFLYESLWNTVGFIALHFLSEKRRYDGQIALGYLAWYGLGRAMIEGLRTDSLYLGPFRINQLLAALACAVAVIVLVVQAFRTHDKANLFVNRVAAQKAAAEAEAVSEE